MPPSWQPFLDILGFLNVLKSPDIIHSQYWINHQVLFFLYLFGNILQQFDPSPSSQHLCHRFSILCASFFTFSLLLVTYPGLLSCYRSSLQGVPTSMRHFSGALAIVSPTSWLRAPLTESDLLWSVYELSPGNFELPQEVCCLGDSHRFHLLSEIFFKSPSYHDGNKASTSEKIVSSFNHWHLNGFVAQRPANEMKGNKYKMNYTDSTGAACWDCDWEHSHWLFYPCAIAWRSSWSIWVGLSDPRCWWKLYV